MNNDQNNSDNRIVPWTGQPRADENSKNNTSSENNVQANNTTGNYYEILGLSQDATQADIKKHYRQLTLANHPDKFQGDQKAQQGEIAGKIREAYEILVDDINRKNYNYYLSTHGDNSNLAFNDWLKQRDTQKDANNTTPGGILFDTLNGATNIITNAAKAELSELSKLDELEALKSIIINEMRNTSPGLDDIKERLSLVNTAIKEITDKDFILKAASVILEISNAAKDLVDRVISTNKGGVKIQGFCDACESLCKNMSHAIEGTKLGDKLAQASNWFKSRSESTKNATSNSESDQSNTETKKLLITASNITTDPKSANTQVIPRKPPSS